MDSSSPTPRPSAPRTLSIAGWVFVAASAFFGAAAVSCTARLLAPSAPSSSVSTEVRPTTSVVTAMRDLARLEGASYHVERVIDIRDHQSRLFGLVEGDDAVLLVAAGDVVAGVDLTQMTADDVQVDPEARRAILALPPPEVFSARLDNERTFVHTRDTDVFATRSETLETRARQEAESTLRAAAIDSGILARAQVNVARTLEALVGSLGYREVEVRWREE